MLCQWAKIKLNIFVFSISLLFMRILSISSLIWLTLVNHSGGILEVSKWPAPLAPSSSCLIIFLSDPMSIVTSLRADFPKLSLYSLYRRVLDRTAMFVVFVLVALNQCLIAVFYVKIKVGLKLPVHDTSAGQSAQYSAKRERGQW